MSAIVLSALTDRNLDISEECQTSSHGCVRFLVLSKKEIVMLFVWICSFYILCFILIHFFKYKLSNTFFHSLSLCFVTKHSLFFLKSVFSDHINRNLFALTTSHYHPNVISAFC